MQESLLAPKETAQFLFYDGRAVNSRCSSTVNKLWAASGIFFGNSRIQTCVTFSDGSLSSSLAAEVSSC